MLRYVTLYPKPYYKNQHKINHPKTNMKPEKGVFVDDVPFFQGGIFRFHVSFHEFQHHLGDVIYLMRCCPVAVRRCRHICALIPSRAYLDDNG